MTEQTLKVGQIERKTQDRVVKLFQEKLNYAYLGNLEENDTNSNIDTEFLTAFLTKSGYTDSIIEKALFELDRVSTNQIQSLYDINKEIYGILRYGLKIKDSHGELNQTVNLIDWKHPENNDFAIAEEVTVKGLHTKRPDIVIYVNGIALGVIELKRSVISVSEGIRQNLDNQKEIFIKQFFTTIQLVMAGNDTEGLKYGTIETPEKHYLSWKESNFDGESILDRHILQICNKARFLEIIHDFTVFDRGVKKVCRHNQYFGVKAAQERLKRREGGIIWHTQGSGKSLTMVWLAKWIRENIENSRVLLITDRDELDKQIEKVYKGVQEDIYRTKSGKDLINVLDETKPWLICTLIHKFGHKETAEDTDFDQFIQDIKQNLPTDFKAKGDVYVFVDECHRTQSGKLHEAMKQILPDSVFIGFTGTPLLNKDKQSSLEVFGTYIHTYKYDEAVKDNVVLDLRYEARFIDQNITSQEKVDQWFDAKTRGLTDLAKAELKKRWGTLQSVLSSQSRLEQIVKDILLDFETKDRLQSGRGNAMLVSGSIYQACKYYELFQKAGFTKCAIVTSYSPTAQSIKGETTGEESVTERLKQYEIYNQMLNGKTSEDFEDEVKEKFIEEPGQMKLLIVVDKLLTGFDAPSATYLFIDKSMRDHGLFQAICRVNRLDGDDKEYGYIIDYKDLFKSLEHAITDYTSEAFADYSKEDVVGLLENRLTKGKDKLEEALEELRAFCEPVAQPKDTTSFIHYFCGDPNNLEDLKETEQRRLTLYKMSAHLLRTYADMANELEKAGYTNKQSSDIKQEVTYFENIRSEIKLASGDYIDLKSYEPAMRHLIDSYISAADSQKISAFDDLTLIDMIVSRGVDAIDALPSSIRDNKEAVAEVIESNVRKQLVDEMATNPKYYQKMSELLTELVLERRQESLDYQEYLKRIVELAKMVKNPSNSQHYPGSINTKAKQALYDNTGKNEELAIKLDQTIKGSKSDDWLGHKIKERQIKNAIYPLLVDLTEEEINGIFDIIKNQNEYR